MTPCPLCHRSDLPLLLIWLLFCALLASIFVGYGAMERLKAEFEGKLREVAGKQASLVLNGATYATVHHHASGEWVVTPEPIDLTPPKNNKKDGKK